VIDSLTASKQFARLSAFMAADASALAKTAAVITAAMILLEKTI
jgi:hypothetical protein